MTSRRELTVDEQCMTPFVRDPEKLPKKRGKAPEIEPVSVGQLRAWSEQLKGMYPDLPEGVINQALCQYKRNPDVFNKCCEDFKKKPKPPRERDDISKTFSSTYSGNDIPWGKVPENSEN